jgi:hypothetical protein
MPHRHEQSSENSTWSLPRGMAAGTVDALARQRRIIAGLCALAG